MSLQTESVPSGVSDGEYSRYTVLIADDQAGMRDVIERILSKRLGCRLIIAISGEEAVDILRTQNIDVMLTDMIMPGLHGMELLKAAKSVCAETAIIVMTGYPADFPYVDVVHAGAEDFIRKPFPPAELEAKLLRLFRERDLQRQRQVAESKYQNLFEMSMDGMLIINEETRIILNTNEALRNVMQAKREDIVGKPVLELFEERDSMRLEQWLTVCAHGGRGTITDLTLRSAGEKKVHVDVSVTFIRTDKENVVFIALKDITDKIIVEQQLAEAAQRDSLTGLYNKRIFQNRLESCINRAREKHLALALVFVDLDNFKKCNDTHGHQVGDELLVSVGEAIGKSIRATSDDGFRLGGDEFALILVGAGPEHSMRVAERMQAEFLKHETYGTTMSIGIAHFEESMPSEVFVRAADDALYKAKGAGKNTICTA
jgi:diguanylate cyclase (GGDEF)-like protein/PAS domain S-box-containing protein